MGIQGGKEKILLFSLQTKEFIPVAHPQFILKYRKSIDGFFAWEEEYIAIDNHIHPKYLLRYHRTPVELSYVDRIRLQEHGPEERIKMGVLWGNTLVLLSQSANRIGTTTFAHIGFRYYRNSWCSAARITERSREFERRPFLM